MIPSCSVPGTSHDSDDVELYFKNREQGMSRLKAGAHILKYGFEMRVLKRLEKAFEGRVAGAARLDADAPLAGLLRRGAAPAACGRLPVSTTNLDFIYSASLVIHPKNGKHESHHKRHDALESIREYSIFRHPRNTSQT